MLIAKSYKTYDILCDPFTENNKLYVYVRNPRTGTEKKARVYTQTEYDRLYPEDAAKKRKPNPKKALGFEKGYITIFKGDQSSPENSTFLKLSNARWAKWWGWYIVSTEPVPENLPDGLTPVKLKWNDVSMGIRGVVKPQKINQAVCKALGVQHAHFSLNLD